MIFRKTIVAVFALLITSTAVADQNKLLVQNFLNSFASRDAQGLFNLINWEGVDKESRRSLQKFIKSGFKGRQIRRIYIEPIAPGIRPSYVQDGKTYQLNLEPSGQLNIVYISNAGKRTTTQLYVGDHQGKLMIGSAVVAPETQVACSKQAQNSKGC